MLIQTRRDFVKTTLRSVVALSAAGTLGRYAELNALAATSPSYQALVCIFLAGGNDGNNMVVPMLTVAQNSLLPVANGSDTYGLNPNLVELQGLYNTGKAAIVANVGMLVQPIDAVAYNSGAPVPVQLFSHSDQTTQWQSASTSELLNTGWGGRLMDSLPAQNTGAQFPAITSTGGCGLFCSGVQNVPMVVQPGSTQTLNVSTASARALGQQQLLTFDNGLQIVQQANSIFSRGITYSNTLASLLPTVHLQTVFPANNPLASQLQTVAQIMAVRNSLGLTRQIFFCQLGGFDTHAGQVAIQNPLLQQLSQAMSAFYQATQELLIDQNVTTFTASEFGRTLIPNGDGGSDHAWGNHHFVVGSGVKGGSIYGNFPLLAAGTDYDATGRGAWIPTTALDQYGATLAQWFGVSSGLSSVFPNLPNFTVQNLGFLG